MRKPKKYHYIYKITRFDGKYYIGRRSTDDLDDGYFGSGVYIRNSVKRYGKDAHKKEILEFCEDKQKLILREAEIVTEEIVNDPLCMNLTKGGGGEIIYTEDMRYRMRMKKLGTTDTEETKLKKSKSAKEAHTRPEVKDKRSVALKKSWENDEERRKKTSEFHSKRMKGSTHTPETIEKLREARKNQVFTKEQIEKRSEKNRGKKRTPEQCKNISESLKGKSAGKWMNKNGEVKRIPNGRVDEMLSDGWVFGRKGFSAHREMNYATR